MKLLIRSVLIMLPLALVTTTTVVGQRRYEPAGRGAFLGFQVDSTEELIAVLEDNPELRQRYARHFGVGEAEVIDFIRRALVPHRLTKDTVVTNYGVTRGGRVFSKRERLRRGTKVWATRSGVPVLKWACANPLTKMLPGTRLASRPKPAGPLVARGGRVSALPMLDSQFAQLEEDFLPLLPEDVQIIAAAGGAGGAAPSGIGGAGPLIAPIIAGGGGGGGLGFLAPLAFLPFVTGGGGGGGGGDIIITPPVNIPEPGTFALMALGLPAAVLVHRRRRR